MRFKSILLVSLPFWFVAGLAQNQINPDWILLSDASTSDGVADLWVSPQGESFVTGNVTTVASNPNMDGTMLVKADNAGNEVWRQYHYAPSTDWRLTARSILGDDSGNIYAVFSEAYRYTDYASNRIVIKKIAADGDLIWTSYATADQNGLIEEVAAREMRIQNGVLYLAGSRYDNVNAPQSHLNGLVARVDTATGSVIDKISYNGPYNSDDTFKQLEVDSQGNFWVIGRSKGLAGPGGIYSNYDSVVIHYSNNAALMWEYRLNGTGNAEDFGINIDVDSDGNCYASSQIKQLSISLKQVVVTKLSPGGAVIWNYSYSGSSSEYLWKQPVKVLPNGNVAIVSSGADGITTKVLNPLNGSVVWTNSYNRNNMGAANHQRDMVVDSEGNIIITGQSRDNTPLGAGYDMTTLKYSSTGELLWLSHYDRGNYSTSGDQGVVAKIDASNNIYAIGWTSDATFDDDYVLMKFGSSLGTSEAENFTVVAAPNPAGESIYVQLPHDIDAVSPMLYDLNGRLLHRWPDTTGQSFVLDLSGIASGVYMLSIDTSQGRCYTRIIKS